MRESLVRRLGVGFGFGKLPRKQRRAEGWVSELGRPASCYRRVLLSGRPVRTKQSRTAGLSGVSYTSVSPFLHVSVHFCFGLDLLIDHIL